MKNTLIKMHRVFQDFLTLKKLRRTGWQMRGIRDCESLADHCFGVAILTMVLGDSLPELKIDRQKALRMAILHELAECRVGDIPFPALEFLQGKSQAETRAFKAIMNPLGAPAEEYQCLFEEFESGVSAESKFVRAVDKLEMLITAFEYERIGFRALQDFWDNDKTFETFKPFPAIDAYVRHLAKTRQKQ